MLMASRTKHLFQVGVLTDGGRGRGHGGPERLPCDLCNVSEGRKTFPNLDTWPAFDRQNPRSSDFSPLGTSAATFVIST